jgi:hypothetical protein
MSELIGHGRINGRFWRRRASPKDQERFGKQLGLGRCRWGLHEQHDRRSGVPEPSAWAMLRIGFAAMGFVGLRKARARSTISVA